MAARLLKAIRHPIRTARWLMPYDYSSPGLEKIPAGVESYFPNVVRTRSRNASVPHASRMDVRFPVVGLLTWDEATILYNYGRMLRDKPFLEIGCWIGWSTVITGFSGTQISVIDPVLGGEPQGEACRDSLNRAGLSSQIKLHGGFSPEAIERFTPAGQKWSGFFVDGNHDGDAPTQDVSKCHHYAANDCVLLLHDMVMPPIRDALRWLQRNGWHVGIHCTTQVIGVAWRGNLNPIAHRPDPAVNWKREFAANWPELLDFDRLEPR
jgi:Methyltransferase domain